MTDPLDAAMHRSDRMNGNESTAAQRESDAIADTVLALADDMLTAFPPDMWEGADAVYDWLIAQAAQIRMSL